MAKNNIGKHPNYNIQVYYEASVSYPSDTTARITITFSAELGNQTSVQTSGVKVSCSCNGISHSKDILVGCDADNKATSAGNPYTKTYTFDITRTSSEQKIPYTFTVHAITSGSETGTIGQTTTETIDVKAKPQCTITFNANGGDVNSVPASVTAVPGNFNIPSKIPTKTGHSFLGWTPQSTKRETHTEINVKTNNIIRTNRITSANSNYMDRISTGYVKSTDTWEILANVKSGSQVKAYIWTYSNGNDSQKDMQAGVLNPGSWERRKQTFNYGAQFQLSPHFLNNTKEDLIDYIAHVYVYDDSNNALAVIGTNSGGNYFFDRTFLPDDPYSYNFNLDLYAQWTPNILTVKYHANGGKTTRENFYVGVDTGTIGYKPNGDGSGQHWADDWTYNEPQPNGLQDPESFGLVREGYTFKGWCLNIDGDGTIFNPYDNTITPADIAKDIETSNLTVLLYAIWEPNSYTITFNPNGGTVSPTTKVVQYDSKYGTLPTPVLENHVLYGWFTALDGGVRVTADDIVKLKNDITLYALWITTAYSINYNKNTPLESVKVQDMPIELTVQKVGEKTNLSVSIPKRTRHTFLGWSESANDSDGNYYNPGDEFFTESDITLYAIWRCDDKSVYMTRGGKIEAIGFKTDITDNCAYIDREGYFHAKEFNTSIGSDELDNDFAYIGKDGVVYCVEAITI